MKTDTIATLIGEIRELRLENEKLARKAERLQSQVEHYQDYLTSK